MIVFVFIAIGIIGACTVLLSGEIRSYLARVRSKQQHRTAKRSFASPKVNWWWSIAWTISLALLCLGIVAYGRYFPQATWDHLPYHLGRKLGDGFIIWLIFNVTVGRKQGYMRASLAFLLISGATTATGLISYAEAQNAAEHMKTELRQLVADPTNAHESLPYAERQIDTVSATTAEFAEMERFIKTFVNKMAAARNDYSREMAASGLEHILDPKRLEQDSTLLESKMIVQRAKEIVTKYRTNDDTMTKNVEEEMASLSLSEENRREFARGLKDGMKKGRSLRDDIWECEAKIVSTIDQIVRLLAERRDTWALENGQIVFGSEVDSSQFEFYLNTLQELARKEEEIAKQGLEALERLLK